MTEKVMDAPASEAERRARHANKADLWDRLWTTAETRDWRREALNRVYTRVERLLPMGQRLVDLGGGVGELAARLAETRGAEATVVDHSHEALREARARGLLTDHADLEEEPQPWCVDAGSWIVCTEVLEHLSARAREFLVEQVAAVVYEAGEEPTGAFFSVPNNRLGPEEEPQHTIAFTARSFLALLRHYFKDARVEAMGPFLLGVVGAPAIKRHTLSVCLPVRDEERDLEAVLGSFRGVADQLVVGVDPRSMDRTWEIAQAYADEVFHLDDPTCRDEANPIHDPSVPPDGVHFSWCRNQVVDRCTSEWIFMTEGHERLLHGEDTLLALGAIMPAEATIGFVWRQGASQQWGYPWLFKTEAGYRYERATHNELRYPVGTKTVKLPQIVTLHERHRANAAKRATQRKAQNKSNLLEDWTTNENAASLFYFAQEIKFDRPDEAIARYEEFLDLEAAKSNGLTRYQARLELARLYSAKEQWEDIRRVLAQAADDDWSRTEHWIWLGDLAFQQDQLEQALQFYRYAGTVVSGGGPPFTLWWVDLACYSYLPAQRLAMCYGHLGKLEEALEWARRVLDLLPIEAPVGCFDEARSNVKLLEEAIQHDHHDP